MVRVARCGPEAAAAVHALTQAAFAGYDVLEPPSGALAETVGSVAADLAAHGGLLAVDAAGEPVACLRFARHDGHLFARRVAVRPDRQGAGVGRLLMAAAEDYGRARGEPELRLGVRHALPGNRLFYARLGYAEVRLHRRPDGSPFWVELRKPLA